MRLLLDAHVSGQRVGGPLRMQGHDVRAVHRERHLDGLADDALLALATADERILVTHNVVDFPAILREWATAGRSHAGVILLYGIDHREFGLNRRGIERWLERRPSQSDWIDFPAVGDPPSRLSSRSAPAALRS